MTHGSDKIQVRVHNRILWVGDDAYPLPNIASVRPKTIVPRRWAAVREFVVRVARPAGYIAGGTIVLACLGDKAPFALQLALALVSGIVLAPHVVRLVRRLRQPWLYALLIGVGSGQTAFVINSDRAIVHDLMERIVHAVNHPTAEFSVTVEHWGDWVLGDKIGGDKVGGDKIEMPS
ncbi:hypothetical protein Val02_52180 [Virgisporangium aliadipatigenens]|uniref:Uncharacterized protein n=1 Tax=Virgisporangium aliadipatigenens TaxID=741659 RepID=A0A8J3YPR6_9ACTN|nr:DUF6232 family protein [Virgisporangium aliadipatigenens]GIJ48332.1 hypothetical protein Val02_52180 [Virgisporangium aliadipatigenens]